MKPILFSTEMVRVILDGRKTQTRRVIKDATNFDGLECISVDPFMTGIDSHGEEYPKQAYGLWATFTWDGLPEFPMCKSKYQPGDILWVRETWCNNNFGMFYRSDWPNDNCPDMDFDDKWRPSIHMPRAAARIFLRVTDVRVERVQEINYDSGDIWREGIPAVHDRGSEVNAFINLWDSINAKRGYSWSTNPWVWVYEFERVEKPEA